MGRRRGRAGPGRGRAVPSRAEPCGASRAVPSRAEEARGRRELGEAPGQGAVGCGGLAGGWAEQGGGGRGTCGGLRDEGGAGGAGGGVGLSRNVRGSRCWCWERGVGSGISRPASFGENVLLWSIVSKDIFKENTQTIKIKHR